MADKLLALKISIDIVDVSRIVTRTDASFLIATYLFKEIQARVSKRAIDPGHKITLSFTIPQAVVFNAIMNPMQSSLNTYESTIVLGIIGTNDQALKSLPVGPFADNHG